MKECKPSLTSIIKMLYLFLFVDGKNITLLQKKIFEMKMPI